MCGRFTLAKSRSEVERYLFEEFTIDDQIIASLPRYNIAPRQTVIAITYEVQNFKLMPLTWGFIPSFGKNKDSKLELINVRIESLMDKWFLKEALQHRRCLILADGFYEWEKTDQGKLPYRIHINEKMFFFAGVYSQYSVINDGQYTTAMITKEASEMMKVLHHRMPVILKLEDAKKYLIDGVLNPESFIGDHYLKMYPVSKKVNKVDVDELDCIKKEEPIRLEI